MSRTATRKPLERSAFDCVHVKSVRAWALLHPDSAKRAGADDRDLHAGKIIANFSDNPAGSVCTCSLYIWSGPLAGAHDGHMTGTAGGYGYDKFSAAFSDALSRCGVAHPSIAGVGDSAVRSFFESHGYRVIDVL